MKLSKKKKKAYLTTITFVSILIMSFGIVLSQFYLPLSSNRQEKIFTIKEGERVSDIASDLEKSGIIKNRYFFILYLVLNREIRNLKAGSYQLSSSMSIKQIAKKLVSGEMREIKITIIEGWTLGDIAKYLEELGICQKEKFLELAFVREFSKEFDFLNDAPPDATLEGYLFPDTYFVEPGSEKNIIRKMLSNFGRKLTPELRQGIKMRRKTIFEIVTMASLLEKEVKTKEDKRLVSGILWKRLREGIPLQVDATITYITKRKTAKISREDTKIDSPYNTYKFSGLPKGPICNPGLDSIIAAVYPKNSQYFYYLSNSEGKTIFSKTLREHNLNKAKYLRK